MSLLTYISCLTLGMKSFWRWHNIGDEVYWCDACEVDLFQRVNKNSISLEVKGEVPKWQFTYWNSINVYCEKDCWCASLLKFP